MSHLDNRSLIKQIDQHNYLDHILDIPEQLLEGYQLGHDTVIPASFAQAKHVLLLASTEMLPVALALEAMMLDYARVPIVVQTDFVLPKWVSNETLVVGLDYYGDNEQVLTAFRSAAKQKARLLAISVAGDLLTEARRFRAHHVPINYGAPARVAYFYTLACTAALFKRLDFIELKESMVSEASVLCRSLIQNLHPDTAQYKNGAKQLAEKIAARKAVIIAAGPMISVAKKWQINFATTSKYTVLTTNVNEFNEALINSVTLPLKGGEQPVIIMLQSKYDYPRVKLQQTLAYQVAQARKLIYEPIFMHPSGAMISEIALAALYGELTSYYLALLLGQDPSYLEATAYIKEQLLQQPLHQA